jgi:hypothetical protein
MTTQPLWLRTVMVREGDDVVTRCCVVTPDESGMPQVFPIEVRVNVPKLIASMRALGFEAATSDQVGGFGSFLKKAVRSVTHNKIVKAVGKVVGKVAKNPIVQLANPMLAISAHTISKGAGGKGVIKGAAGHLVDMGAAAATKAVPMPSAMSFVSPKAAAALGVGIRTVMTARAGGVIAAVAKNAQNEIDHGKNVAQGIIAKTVSPAAGRALVQRAVNIRSNIAKHAPALAKHVVLSSKVKASLATIAAKARAGSADARLAASVIGRSAQALDHINALNQASAGGVAGMLLTADGRVVRAPKGRYVQRSTAAARPDVLYRGAKDPTLRGSFSAVAGTKAKVKRRPAYKPAVTALQKRLQDCEEAFDELWQDFGDATGDYRPRYDDPRVIDVGWSSGVGAGQSWGGALDPGNNIDGPFTAVHYPGDRVMVEDFSAVAGALTP